MRILIAAALAFGALAGTATAQDFETRTTTVTSDGFSPPQVSSTRSVTLSDAPRSPATFDADGRVLVAESVGAPTPGPYPFQGICGVAHGSCPASYSVTPGQACNCFLPGFGDELGITR